METIKRKTGDGSSNQKSIQRQNFQEHQHLQSKMGQTKIMKIVRLAREAAGEQRKGNISFYKNVEGASTVV